MLHYVCKCWAVFASDRNKHILTTLAYTGLPQISRVSTMYGGFVIKAYASALRTHLYEGRQGLLGF